MAAQVGSQILLASKVKRMDPYEREIVKQQRRKRALQLRAIMGPV